MPVSRGLSRHQQATGIGRLCHAAGCGKRHIGKTTEFAQALLPDPRNVGTHAAVRVIIVADVVDHALVRHCGTFG